MSSSAPTPAEPAITIVLADDHHVVRSGLRLLLDAEPGLDVVADAADAEAALRSVPVTSRGCSCSTSTCPAG